MPSETSPSKRSSPGASAYPPPKPQGNYRAAIVLDRVVVTAGMTPRRNSVMQYPGRVGAEVSLDDAARAARIAADNALAALSAELGSLDRLAGLLRLTVYISAVDGFTAHSKVADAASARIAERLGERGRAVRSAVGVASLPGGACLELELTGLIVD